MLGIITSVKFFNVTYFNIPSPAIIFTNFNFLQEKGNRREFNVSNLFVCNKVAFKLFKQKKRCTIYMLSNILLKN